MKSRLSQLVLAASVLAGIFSPAAIAAQEYKVTILTDEGSAGANSLNNRGWAAGQANNAEGTASHAVVWVNGGPAMDLGTLGSPKLNSAIAWPVKNNGGIVVGISDTDQDNPLAPLNNAFSCWPFFAPGEPTGKVCKGFRWERGVMTALEPFPGGYNSYASAANNRGQVVGWAETGVHDPTCDSEFQTLGFQAALWDADGNIHALPPLPGDSTSAATAINDKGQVVGISGDCGIAVGGVSAKQAVIWENGVPTRIDDLGGHSWNTPTAINNNGVVIGFSLPLGQDGTQNYKAFVWTKEGGTKVLSEVPGTIRSLALGINNFNQIVGRVSLPTGRRAVIWQSPTAPVQMLNDLAPGAPILMIAGDINDNGQITGYTATDTGFLATPK